MSYSIYKNKKILKDLSDKEYRLLQFNSKINNPFHIFLLFSVIPDEINNKSVKELNVLGEIYKKNLNKFVKKKFNKNYMNSNLQKDLDIFTDLFHYNISIFDTNFDNIISHTKNKKYTKRLYFLNRDDDLFLLVKKNKNGIKIKFNNNVIEPIQTGGAPRLKGVKLSGEFFDLSIPSYNDLFGFKKINATLTNGINIPLMEYIDELILIIPINKILGPDPQYLEDIFKNFGLDNRQEVIGHIEFLNNYPDFRRRAFDLIGKIKAHGFNLDPEWDDKTYKRIKRLNFLLLTKNINGIDNYFKAMMNYLNGGTNYTTKLIFIISGGNIIKIFARLIKDILNSNDSNYETQFNKVYATKSQQFPLIKRDLDVTPEITNEFLDEIIGSGFSDFDYNLLPNIKAPLSRESINLDINKPNGFALYRIKTAIDVNKYQIRGEYNIPRFRGRKECEELVNSGKLSREILKKLYPQGINQDILKNFGNLNTTNECYKFIDKLLFEKELIQTETERNVKQTIQYIINNRKFPVTNDIDSIMFYINDITKNLNETINTFENKNNINIKDFETLSTLSESKNINLLVHDILIDFLNKIKHTEEILDVIGGGALKYIFSQQSLNSKFLKFYNINPNYSEEDGVSTLIKPTIYNIPSEGIGNERKIIADKIRMNIKENDEFLPFGIQITLNIIKKESDMNEITDISEHPDIIEENTNYVDKKYIDEIVKEFYMKENNPSLIKINFDINNRKKIIKIPKKRKRDINNNKGRD